MGFFDIFRTQTPTRRVVLTEVTRMQPGFFCVAGVDLDSGNILRPLPPRDIRWRAQADGAPPFSVGTVLKCQFQSNANRSGAHGAEDRSCIYMPTQVGRMTPAELHTTLLPSAKRDVSEVYGAPLLDGMYLEEGRGAHSLGCLRVEPGSLSFHQGNRNAIRVDFKDASGASFNLKLTCHTLCSALEAKQANLPGLNAWAARADQPVLLRMGLARPWNGGHEHNYNPRRCYAQINGLIYPELPLNCFQAPVQDDFPPEWL